MRSFPDTSFIDPNPALGIREFFDHEQHFTREHTGKLGPALQVAETSVSTLYAACDAFTSFDWERLGWHRLLQAQILCSSVPDLFCAFRLGTKGFPDQANILVRNAIEQIFQVMFIEHRPKEWESVFVSHRDLRKRGVSTKGRTPFVVMNFIKNTLGSEEIAKWFYEIPSHYAHGHRTMNAIKVGSLHQGDGSSLTAMPVPPKSLTYDMWMGTYLNVLHAALWMHLTVHDTLFSASHRAELSARILQVRVGMREWCSKGPHVYASLVEAVEGAFGDTFTRK